MEHSKDPDLWGALVILLFTAFLSALVIVDRKVFVFSFGPFPFTHWMSWIGGLWIAIVTPIYYIGKHRNPERYKAWIRFHLYGNLIAFMLISIHFTYWITSVSFIGTGLAVYVSVLTLVITGLLQRFLVMNNFRKHIRFLHVSMTTAFYLILIIHILSRFIRL